jgi:hypothetical protein
LTYDNDLSTVADPSLTFLEPGVAETSVALHQLPADEWVDFAKQKSEERSKASKASADLQSQLRPGLESYLASQSEAHDSTTATPLTGCAAEFSQLSGQFSGPASLVLTQTA